MTVYKKLNKIVIVDRISHFDVGSVMISRPSATREATGHENLEKWCNLFEVSLTPPAAIRKTLDSLL